MFNGKERICGGDGVWFCGFIFRGSRNEVGGRLSRSSLGHGGTVKIVQWKESLK